MYPAWYRIINFHYQLYIPQNTDLIHLLHVSARQRYQYEGVLSVANVGPSKWSVA
jgi:hypothetical protein